MKKIVIGFLILTAAVVAAKFNGMEAMTTGPVSSLMVDQEEMDSFALGQGELNGEEAMTTGPLSSLMADQEEMDSGVNMLVNKTKSKLVLVGAVCVDYFLLSSSTFRDVKFSPQSKSLPPFSPKPNIEKKVLLREKKGIKCIVMCMHVCVSKTGTKQRNYIKLKKKASAKKSSLAGMPKPLIFASAPKHPEHGTGKIKSKENGS